MSSKKEPGHWIFPKGHVERGETAAEAALRETEEEAGVTASCSALPERSSSTGAAGHYRVEYFLIRATSETSRTDGRSKVWLPFADALARLTYADTQRLLRDAHPRMVDGA